MAKQLTVDTLFDSLQTAIKSGVIEEWDVEGMRVVIRRGSAAFHVPALEAGIYVPRLSRRRDRTFEFDTLSKIRGNC